MKDHKMCWGVKAPKKNNLKIKKTRTQILHCWLKKCSHNVNFDSFHLIKNIVSRVNAEDWSLKHSKAIHQAAGLEWDDP